MERDDIVVRYDPLKINIDEILEACKDTGFPATVVTEPPREPEMETTDAIEAQDPAFFLAALATAKEERKPVVLDFSAEWCAPCQQMLRDVFPDPGVAKLLKRFVFVTIDTDEHPGLARKFGVVGIPDIRVLSPNGTELRQLLGFHDAKTFAEELNESLRDMEEEPTQSSE